MNDTRGAAPAIGDDPEYRSLLRVAARMGADPLLVQAAGGNVSFKRDGVLWVKASGTWLAHAEARNVMVPVRLAPLLAALDDGDAAEDRTPFVEHSHNPDGLRPSIETTMHGVLAHRVVIHVHCVRTIAWAARADAASALAPLLDGLRWRFVPYVRPGLPLTRAILSVLGPDTDVLVLGNHGLVTAGPDTDAAEALVAEMGRRLDRAPRPAPAPDLPRLHAVAEGGDYAPAEDAALHGIATDPASLRAARAGSLYPDHVIFLGAGITEAAEPGAARDQTAAMLVVPGAGVLLRRDASAGALALARCLADVTARFDPGWTPVALTATQDAELLGWDAEKYRQALEAR